MSEKYQQKYRSDSTRLKHWDYGAIGAYFVTICTKDRETYFGEIIDGEMRCSEIGKIVEIQWLKNPSVRPDMNLQLGEYVVMPDHFHGILMIGENEFNRDKRHATAYPGNKFGPQSKNLASIIRGFKSAVTTNARLIHAGFEWQSNYYEHIIRDAQSFEKISHYIATNIKNWKGNNF
jgi:putative transposase